MAEDTSRLCCRGTVHRPSRAKDLGGVSALPIWFALSCDLLRQVPTRASMDLPFIFYRPLRTRWLWWSTSLRRMQQSTARCRAPVASYLCGGRMLPHACSELTSLNLMVFAAQSRCRRMPRARFDFKQASARCATATCALAADAAAWRIKASSYVHRLKPRRIAVADFIGARNKVQGIMRGKCSPRSIFAPVAWGYII